MRVETGNLSVKVSISDLISTATRATDVLLDTEANFHLFLAEQKMHERCASMCNLVNRSMHAPTIMTLAEIMLKISRSFPSERNRIRMSLQRNNGADVDGLHRMIGEERDPCLAVKDASPDAVDVVTLVDCVHNNVRGKVVWEEVSKVQLGDLSIVPLSNTILATELGLWFGCYSAPASVDMNDIQSISIHETKPSICAISLLSAIDSFGDVSIETATSTVHVVLKNSSEAQAFLCDLQNKFDLFKKLDDFARRSAVSKISIASATTASLYRSQDIHGTGALPPKKSKDKEQKSSTLTAKTNKLPIVSVKPVQSNKAVNSKGADAGKKKSVPATDSFVAEDYSMDIDYGNEDLPIDDGVSHDVTAKPLGNLFCFLQVMMAFAARI